MAEPSQVKGQAKGELLVNTRLLDGLIITALVLMLGQQLLDNQFVSNDYAVLGRISELPNHARMFLHAQFDHVLPVRNALLFGEFTRFGENPRPYYVVNILLHLSATLLLWRWVDQLTNRRLPALFAALLFGLGGVHWKSVCWITAQGQLLAANFMLLSLLLILQAFQRRSISAYNPCDINKDDFRIERPAPPSVDEVAPPPPLEVPYAP